MNAIRSASTVRPLGSARAVLGEGAYWSDRDRCLYWVDIKGRQIFRIKADGSGEQSWATPTEIGFIVEDPRSDSFLGALRKGVANIVLPHGGGNAQIDYIAEPENALQQNRFNDGSIDRHGNVWAGTMDDDEQQATGNWWHMDAQGQVRRQLSGFRVTNGPAFSPDGLHIYLNDSALRRTYRASYDANGLTSELHLWQQFDAEDGYPDGMTFGPDGLLWIAFWDGSCLRGFDEGGALQCQIALPVRRPTKPAFGPNGQGFVTSAGGDGEWEGRLLTFGEACREQAGK